MMIALADLLEWRAIHPLQSLAQVEQDLLISRCLVELYSQDDIAGSLAMRGGTVLHKIHCAPARRYSEDIDLVQIKSGPIGPIFDMVKNALSPLLGKPKRTIGPGVATLAYNVPAESGPPPVLRLKIEINTREHFTVEGYHKKGFEVRSRWYSNACQVTTFSLNELLATKMRALFQRRKGRDLFDLWLGLKGKEADPRRIVEIFDAYMRTTGKPVHPDEYIRNLEAKIVHPAFRSDLTPLLIEKTEPYDPKKAFVEVRDNLFSNLGAGS
jgi:predicted nucleotidyltransferase component of viral defense system